MESEFDSLDLPIEEFKKLGYAVIDMIAQYYEGIREIPVSPNGSSARIENLFREELPVDGQSPDTVIAEWQDRILPNATHLGSPRYFGFVNGSGSMIATLADALASSVNMNSGAWKPGPGATEIERITVKWLAQLIGYPDRCGGLIVSGGTMADFTALLTAFRNKATEDTTNEGLQSTESNGRYRIYMSDHEGHIAIVRSADMMNLGRDAVRRVPSRDDFTMDTTALDRMVREDIASGDKPFCVVAQAGSINVGAIDPMEEIAAICRKYDLWFHVDGACGAVGAMLPSLKPLYKGMELADSVTLDPHKWLYMPYECGCLLINDPEKLRRSFSIKAPYLRGTLPSEYDGLDFLEYGPQMSRGFKALKLWMTLKHYGVKGYQKLLSQNIACARHLHNLVKADENFQSAHEPRLYIYSFRYFPQDLREEHDKSCINQYLDVLNQTIVDKIQLSGLAFIMTSKVRNSVVIRMSVCSHRTTLEDIEIVFEKLAMLGQAIDSKLRKTTA